MTPMNYTNFRAQAGTQECVFVDPDDDTKWDTQSCEATCAYYVCEGYKGRDLFLSNAVHATIFSLFLVFNVIRYLDLFPGELINQRIILTGRHTGT